MATKATQAIKPAKKPKVVSCVHVAKAVRKTVAFKGATKMVAKKAPAKKLALSKEPVSFTTEELDHPALQEFYNSL